MSGRPTLLLSRKEIAALIDLDECIAIVEQGFAMLGEGKAPAPGVLGVHAPAGGLHVKAAYLSGDRSYFAAKVNSNFPDNPRTRELPTVQGVIILCDANTGELLAVFDSIEITIQRTGAATAVAAKYLARRDARIATICGCGIQGMVQLAAIRKVRAIESVYAHDIEASAVRRFIEANSDIKVRTASDLGAAIRQSDIVVTCTPARRFFVHAADVRPGAFVSAVGADNEHKQELDPQLFVSSKVVVDSLAQCSTIGDLHHALDAGLVGPASVYAELPAIIAGNKPGRTSDREITIFDSTGIATEDVATAAYVYEKACRLGLGVAFQF
jgi:alanine dehydrogenase